MRHFRRITDYVLVPIYDIIDVSLKGFELVGGPLVNHEGEIVQPMAHFEDVLIQEDTHGTK